MASSPFARGAFRRRSLGGAGCGACRRVRTPSSRRPGKGRRHYDRPLPSEEPKVEAPPGARRRANAMMVRLSPGEIPGRPRAPAPNLSRPSGCWRGARRLSRSKFLPGYAKPPRRALWPSVLFSDYPIGAKPAPAIPSLVRGERRNGQHLGAIIAGENGELYLRPTSFITQRRHFRPPSSSGLTGGPISARQGAYRGRRASPRPPPVKPGDDDLG